jgi:hypothetical protein
MEFVLARSERDEAGVKAQTSISTRLPSSFEFALQYLSSSPPSFRTMFRSEKTVPKTSFASSSALRDDRPGPTDTPLLMS